MAAYVIVDIEIQDPVLYEQYKASVEPTLRAYGGRYVVRGGRTELLEGERKPGRIVVLEFPSFERAREWWACEEYREPKRMRHASARTQMFVVEGV